MTDVRVASIMIDTTDVERLVEFWTGLLGLEVRARYPSFVFLSRVGSDGPNLAFQVVPEAKAGKNRVHIDIHGPDREVILKRVVELGGRQIEEHEIDGFGWTTCADPEGNEFCVAAE
jgi:catechol 2,3-dioxygenase-like lactoylglutathione lyase family enzyme